MADKARTGELNLRKENVSRVVTGFALQNYLIKGLTMIQNSNSWKETYFRETAADLTNSASPVRGVPRLANFPYGEVTFSEVSNRLEKYGMEGVISWEDATTNEIGVIARTLLRIGRAVAKAVDDKIYSDISSEAGSTVTITADSEWDSATVANRDPIQNILDAKRLIAENNYNPDQGGALLINPKDYANLLGNANVRNAGQFWTDTATRNGRVGMIVGLTVVVTNSVTADEAMVGILKEAVTWQQAKSLTVETITDPGIKWTIRAWEVGVPQVTNPDALCKISNTAA